uniref:Uncharacterized protein n=1 Tax=Nonomuraea gerenzanensis TaxID=93944 RepID=A0A1M4E4V3_9ACTN|nr:hypothetical protein BN4615_P3324 [Nonomuraea gerenzanensis]
MDGDPTTDITATRAIAGAAQRRAAGCVLSAGAQQNGAEAPTASAPWTR